MATPPVPRIVVRPASDGLVALVDVKAGVPLGESELRSALEAAGIRAGLDEAAVARLASGLADVAFAVSAEVVARGTLAQEGEDGYFAPQFREGIQPGHVREDGTVDFHDRELLKPVDKGEALGRIWPARAGVPGRLVDGNVIAVRATREASLVLGPGAERDAEGVVRATRSGVLESKAGVSLDVVDQHLHKGPVDLRSGHLHMQGSLVVQGDVTRGFGVRASGDVEIRGNVEAGSVTAGGSVRVQYGVRSGDGGSVCAEGNVSIHHAEAANVYAGKLLQVGETVHSRLAAGSVEVSGRLRGGLTEAELGIVAREVGSAQGMDTELAVAEPLESPIENARRALEREKALRLAKVGPRSSRGERAKGGKAGRVQAALTDVETERLAERARRRETLSRAAFIQVGIVHPGVTLQIAGHKLSIEQELRATRFSLDLQTGTLRAAKIGS